MTGTLDFAKVFAVLQPDQSVALIDVTPNVYEELDRRFDGFEGRVLVSTFSFEQDWPTWERHPAGDEIVCLLHGDVTLELQTPGGPQTIHLKDAGTYALVPKGTWHTARTSVPTRMLFITPGEGTESRPI